MMTKPTFPTAPDQLGFTDESLPTRLELLWRLYDQHQQMARHHDSQRATICQYILILAAAAVGIAKIGDFSPIVNSVLALFVVGIGGIGALLTRQLSSACASQQNCGSKYLAELKTIVPTLGIEEPETTPGYVAPQPWYIINILVAMLGLAILACVYVHAP